MKKFQKIKQFYFILKIERFLQTYQKRCLDLELWPQNLQNAEFHLSGYNASSRRTKWRNLTGIPLRLEHHEVDPQ